MKTTAHKTRTFTLIELLIVIGLLGALTALILPSLTANREEALGDICDYNQAGTVRILKQYENLVNGYPADMHNGLDAATEIAKAIPGLPGAQKANMVATIDGPCPSIHQLTKLQAKSLSTAGITSICSGTGLNQTSIKDVAGDTDVATSVAVVRAYSAGAYWTDDASADITFDGRSLRQWETAANTPSWDQKEGEGVVVVLWLAPTTDWDSGRGDINDWSKGSVTMAIDMEGHCPIPTEAASGDEVSFAYYMAYFKVYNNGAPARLIGSTCPECGVLNP